MASKNKESKQHSVVNEAHRTNIHSRNMETIHQLSVFLCFNRTIFLAAAAAVHKRPQVGWRDGEGKQWREEKARHTHITLTDWPNEAYDAVFVGDALTRRRQTRDEQKIKGGTACNGMRRM